MQTVKNKNLWITFIYLALFFLCCASSFASDNDTLALKNDSQVILDSARLHIINTAKNYFGIKYLRGGMSEKGFDCSGFVKYVFDINGYELPRTSISQYKDCKVVLLDSILPGDLLFFKTRGKRISHVGIYIGNRQFIHSPRHGKFVAIAKLDEEYWKNRCVAAATIF
jgi:cell wall-associated NlpC family hydrolase